MPDANADETKGPLRKRDVPLPLRCPSLDPTGRRHNAQFERQVRSGILNEIVFGPGVPSGIALSEVLTLAMVFTAIDTASTRKVALE